MLGAVCSRMTSARRSSRRSSSWPKRLPRILGKCRFRTTARSRTKLKKLIGKDIAAAYKLTDKSARSNALNLARAKAKEAFADEDPADPDGRDQADEEARRRNRSRRDPQGRKAHRWPHHHAGPPDRSGMVGFLPRTHGSALFTRGETQTICTTTLGTKEASR
jgi:polyribonucleotide nucleotidyltransferase